MFNNNKTKIKVAVLKDALPFSQCGNDKDQKPTGITVDIWEKVASNYGLDYEYICVNRKYDDTLKAVSKGEYDIALSEFSVIKRRYDLVHYSRPFYISKLSVYRREKENSFENFVTNDIVKIILVSALLMIVFYALLRMYIVKENFLFALYTTYTFLFTNIREFIAEGKRPKTSIKIVNSMWIIMRYIFLTIVVAQAINIIVKTTNYITDEEYRDVKKINVLKGTSYVDFIKQAGKTPVMNDNNQQIIEKLYNSRNEYWFDDPNVINDAIERSKFKLKLNATLKPIINDEFTIAVNKKLPDLLDKINKTIVSLQDNGDMVRMCKGHMRENIENCSI
jgi:ABC-type amino acid transport substrate-binding protein